MSDQTAIGRIDETATGHGGWLPGSFSAGEALVQPSLNRISIHGRVCQVEPKVMQVLVLMARRPGTVVPREDFLEIVWAGTIADDYLLNRAVSELRKILDDDPQAPRYIETIRKGGYRLIAPVAPARVAAAVALPAQEVPPAEVPASSPAPATAPAPAPQSASASPPLPVAPRRRGYGYAAVAAAGIAGLAIAVYALRPALPPPPAEAYEVRPLTSLVGRELEPALSPDGSRVAFIHDGTGAFDVYVKTIGSEDILNLTRSAVDERYPAWMPDGRALLFARAGADGISLLRVSALGGGITRVLQDPAMHEIRGLGLSPDGRHVVYAAREAADAPYRLFLAALDGSSRRELTSPAPGTLGDIDPRFARDGRSLVFVRGVNEVTKDIYRVPLEGGEPVRLTADNRKLNGLAWSPDGSRLLFTSTRSGMYALWSADADGGDLRRLMLGNEDVHQPTTTAGVDAIAFEQWNHRSRLRQIDLARPEAAPSPAQSTRWDSQPAWSPDGARLAFTSNRGGPHGIWVSRSDGSEAVQVASFGGAFIDNPAWSPDGTRIAFDGSPDGRVAIYVVSPEGGAPQRVVDGPGDARNPSWSRDGAWLYFESNRSGQWQVYAQPAAGGEAVAVTPGAGSNARESVDGRHLLFTKPGLRGLWRVPRQDWSQAIPAAQEQLLLAGLAPEDSSNWAPARDGVYFVRRPQGEAPRLAHAGAEGGNVTDIAPLPSGFEGWGFDLSPDQTQLVFSEMTLRESDLRLAAPRTMAQ